MLQKTNLHYLLLEAYNLRSSYLKNPLMSFDIILYGSWATQITILKALEEHKIKPIHVSRTNAEAIIGTLYAASVNWTQRLDLFKNTSIFRTSRYTRYKPMHINSEKFYNSLKNITSKW